MSINLENGIAIQNENHVEILSRLMWFSVGKQLFKTDKVKARLILSGKRLKLEKQPLI